MMIISYMHVSALSEDLILLQGLCVIQISVCFHRCRKNMAHNNALFKLKCLNFFWKQSILSVPSQQYDWQHYIFKNIPT